MSPTFNFYFYGSSSSLVLAIVLAGLVLLRPRWFNGSIRRPRNTSQEHQGSTYDSRDLR